MARRRIRIKFKRGMHDTYRRCPECKGMKKVSYIMSDGSASPEIHCVRCRGAGVIFIHRRKGQQHQ